MIFILGAPKTGSTLLYQIVINFFRVNYFGNDGYSLVQNAASQWDGNNCIPDMSSNKQLHGESQYNYLFVDGHVEFLARGETLSRKDTASSPQGRESGMWTINPNH